MYMYYGDTASAFFVLAFRSKLPQPPHHVRQLGTGEACLPPPALSLLLRRHAAAAATVAASSSVALLGGGRGLDEDEVAGLSLEDDEAFVLFVVAVCHRPGQHPVRPGALLSLLFR